MVKTKKRELKVAKKTENETEKQIVTLRLEGELLDRLESIRKKIQSQRGPGAGEVTRTEVVKILIEHGAKHFDQ
jgi:hypothetical protein